MAKTIANIYGIVGRVEKEKGQPPIVVLEEEYADIAESINRSIEAGEEFVGTDGVSRIITHKVSSEDLEAIGETITSCSEEGSLFLIPIPGYSGELKLYREEKPEE